MATHRDLPRGLKLVQISRKLRLSDESNPVSSTTSLNWSRATGHELRWLVAYWFLILAVTDILNVRPGVELMTGATLAAAWFISRRSMQFLRDWWFVLLGLLLWNTSGPIAAKSPFPRHLNFMYYADHFLFLGRDPVVLVHRALALHSHVNLLDVLAALTYNVHLPEAYIAGYFLWRIDRTVYLQFVSAVLILLVAGFVTFVLFPAVPPWLAALTYGKVRGVSNGFGPVIRAHPLPFHGTPLFFLFRWVGDPVAAFPSEHAALPFLECVAFFRVSRPVSLLLGVWTIWVLFVVVYLGEHWVTDVLAGWLYAAIIFLLVTWFSHRSIEIQASPV